MFIKNTSCWQITPNNKSKSRKLNKMTFASKQFKSGLYIGVNYLQEAPQHETSPWVLPASAAQDPATARGCNAGRAPARAGPLVFAQDPREHGDQPPPFAASHMQNALAPLCVRGRGSCCHAAASAKRSQSTPEESLQSVSKFAELFNALSHVRVFKHAHSSPAAPSVAVSAGLSPPHAGRLWHSSAGSLRDTHLTSELKPGQRLGAIKSISLQSCQMGNLLKEARVVAGGMRFWRCHQVLSLWAAEATAGREQGL